ncbi:MAG: hypothetical protein RLZZ419_1534 [Pseudomonadota bacterium]|jgi:hypothetical protein
MKTIKSSCFITFVLLALAFPAFGQTNAEIEQELIGHIKNIQKWSNYGSDFNEDLLVKENDSFKKKLLETTKIDSTLSYQFSELNKYLHLTSSENGKLRIYSWDTEVGGTMHFFDNVYQFQGKDGKVYSNSNTLQEGNSGAFISDIFDVDTKNGKIYLARFTSVLSGALCYESINLLGIEGDSLNNQIKLIKTKSGLTNSLGFEYDFSSVMDRKERPIKLIVYDKETKTIKIPVVLKDQNFNNGGRVTDKFINYKFDGTYFLKQK